jgi:hypothetical protein
MKGIATTQLYQEKQQSINYNSRKQQKAKEKTYLGRA